MSARSSSQRAALFFSLAAFDRYNLFCSLFQSSFCEPLVAQIDLRRKQQSERDRSTQSQRPHELVCSNRSAEFCMRKECEREAKSITIVRVVVVATIEACMQENSGLLRSGCGCCCGFLARGRRGSSCCRLRAGAGRGCRAQHSHLGDTSRRSRLRSRCRCLSGSQSGVAPASEFGRRTLAIVAAVGTRTVVRGTGLAGVTIHAIQGSDRCTNTQSQTATKREGSEDPAVRVVCGVRRASAACLCCALL